MERARVAAMVAVRPGQAHPVADGCVRLVVENAFSANFIVTRVLLVLDGSRVFDRAEQVEGRGRLANTPLFRAFLDARAPGKHELQVLVNMKGDGAGATFYMKGYRFEVRSHHELMLVSTGGIEIRVVLYEKTPMSPKLEERPALRYEVITRRPLTEPLAPP